MSDFARTAFNTGEISPRAIARSDQVFRKSACAVMKGFAAQVQGGAIRPSGTLYVGDVSFVDKGLLVPFAFNLDYVYLLELGENYIRFWRNDALVASGGLVVASKPASTKWSDAGFCVAYRPQPGCPVTIPVVGNTFVKLRGGSVFGDIVSGVYKDVTVVPGSIHDVSIVFNSNLAAAGSSFLSAVLVPRISGSVAPSSSTWYDAACFTQIMPGPQSVSLSMAVPGGVPAACGLLLFHDTGGATYNNDQVVNVYEFNMIEEVGVFELANPYSLDDLSNLRFHSVGDQIFITSQKYQTRVISRNDIADFSISVFDPDYPPFRLENPESAKTLTPSATTGSITVASSWDYFTANHVGMEIEIRKVVSAAETVGRLKITTVSGLRSASATVLDTLPAAEATSRWAESAWNLLYGFPAVVASAHDRLIFGSTPFEPGAYWLSERGGYKNFCVGAADTDAISRLLPDNPLMSMVWMRGFGGNVIVGTLAGEYIIHSGSTGPAWTPSTVRADRMSGYGSADVPPVEADSDILFVQTGGKTLRRFAREMEDTEGLYKSDLLVLAEHLTRNDPLVSIAFAGPPYQALFGVTAAGQALAMTFMKEHQVFAWWRPNIGGVARGVAVLPGRTMDSVYWAVRRVINGTVKVCLEKQVEFFTGENLSDAYFMACGKRTTGTGLTVLTGLGHLEGATVDVVADGVYQGQQVVTGAQVTVAAAASSIAAGLPVPADLVLPPLDFFDDGGRYVDEMRDISAVTLYLDATGEGLMVSGSGTDGDWVRFTELERGSLYAGKATATLMTASDDGSLFIRQAYPMPVNILKIKYHYGN